MVGQGAGRGPRCAPDAPLSPRRAAARARHRPPAVERRVVSGIIETRYVAAPVLPARPRLFEGDADAATQLLHDTLAAVFDTARDEMEARDARGANDPPGGEGEERVLVARGLARLTPARAAEFRRRLAALRTSSGRGTGCRARSPAPSRGASSSPSTRCRPARRSPSMADVPAAPAFGVRDLLRLPDFRRLYLAQAVSDLGDGMTYLALFLLVLDLTGSTAALALMSILVALPPVTIGLFAGAWADRTTVAASWSCRTRCGPSWSWAWFPRPSPGRSRWSSSSPRPRPLSARSLRLPGPRWSHAPSRAGACSPPTRWGRRPGWSWAWSAPGSPASSRVSPASRGRCSSSMRPRSWSRSRSSLRVSRLAGLPEAGGRRGDRVARHGWRGRGRPAPVARSAPLVAALGRRRRHDAGRRRHQRPVHPVPRRRPGRQPRLGRAARGRPDGVDDLAGALVASLAARFGVPRLFVGGLLGLAVCVGLLSSRPGRAVLLGSCSRPAAS